MSRLTATTLTPDEAAHNGRTGPDGGTGARPPRSAAATLALLATLLGGLLAAPRAASGQPGLDAVAEALVAFTAATIGTYGDEGPQVTAALDAMDRALGAWEAELRRMEAAAQAPDRPPQDRAGLNRELAAAYLRAGRPADAGAALDVAVALAPSDPSLYLIRGAAFEAAGAMGEAARAFHRAWQLARANPVAAYAVWRHRSELGDDAAAQALDVLVAASRLRQHDDAPPPSPPFPTYALWPDAVSDLALPPMAAYADGYRLIERGELRPALARFRAAAAHDPLVRGDALRDPHVRQGLASFKTGRLADAQRLLSEALDAGDGVAEVRRMLGLVYLADYQDEEGIAHLHAAVAEAPADERTRIALARALIESGRLQDAEAMLRETAATVPGSTLAHWWLGTVLLDLNRDGDARRAFERALALPSVGGRLPLQAAITSLYRNEGDYAGASAVLLARVRSHPNDLPSRLELAHAYLQLDRQADASAEYVAALLIEPRSALAHVGLGHLHLAAGRDDEAAAALSRGLALEPALADARYALATALMRLGRSAEGARELEAYHALQSEATAARRRRLSLDVLAEEAASWTLAGAHDRAAALWARLVAEEPADGSHRMSFGAALAAAGRIDEAIEQYERAAALGAGAPVYRALADLHARAGRPEASAAARLSYERALLRLFSPADPAR